MVVEVVVDDVLYLLHLEVVFAVGESGAVGAGAVAELGVEQVGEGVLEGVAV